MVTVCLAEGSTPRGAGTRMVVTQDQTFGTIGGGNLEHQAIAQARQLLRQSNRRAVLQDYPLGPLLAQCCGGHVRLLLERLTTDDQHWLGEAAALLAAGKPIERQVILQNGSIPTVSIGPSEVPAKFAMFHGEAGSDLRDQRPKLNACVRVTEYFCETKPAVFVFGAGHVGRAIATALAPLDLDLKVFDPRPDFQTPISPFGVIVRDYEQARPHDVLSQAPPTARYLIVTHAHELDYALVRLILERGDATYCGLIGSATKRARFIRRLRDDGLPDAAIDRLTCPIGDIGLKSKAPEAIAIGVAAEIAGSLEAGDQDAARSPSENRTHA